MLLHYLFKDRESPKISVLWSPYSRRLRIAILLALALGIEGLMRSNINMAMICMIKNDSSKLQGIVKYNFSEYDGKCMYDNINSSRNSFKQYVR